MSLRHARATQQDPISRNKNMQKEEKKRKIIFLYYLLQRFKIFFYFFEISYNTFRSYLFPFFYSSQILLHFSTYPTLRSHLSLFVLNKQTDKHEAKFVSCLLGPIKRVSKTMGNMFKVIWQNKCCTFTEIAFWEPLRQCLTLADCRV